MGDLRWMCVSQTAACAESMPRRLSLRSHVLQLP